MSCKIFFIFYLKNLLVYLFLVNGDLFIFEKKTKVLLAVPFFKPRPRRLLSTLKKPSTPSIFLSPYLFFSPPLCYRGSIVSSRFDRLVHGSESELLNKRASLVDAAVPVATLRGCRRGRGGCGHSRRASGPRLRRQPLPLLLFFSSFGP